MQAHTSSFLASPLPSLPMHDTERGEGELPVSASLPALAHDARNLLSALTLYAQLLSTPGVLRREHQHYADELRVLADRSVSLMTRMRRTGADETPGRFAQPTSAATLRSILPLLQRIAGESIEVALQIRPATAQVPIASHALERIALNLVRNAVNALKQPGRRFRRAKSIRIELLATSSEATLRVADNGPGMDPWVAARFLHPSPTEAGHLHDCLGHRIVHELTEGSRREVVVRPGRGTTLSFTWPRPSAVTLESAHG